MKALERAIEIDPSNAHALRNLAAIHVKESPSRALPFMQEAARLLPSDQPALVFFDAPSLIEAGLRTGAVSLDRMSFSQDTIALNRPTSN